MLLYDHVAKVDPDAKSDLPLIWHLGLALGHLVLNLHSAADSIHHARELGKEAVASVLYNPASVIADLRVD